MRKNNKGVALAYTVMIMMLVFTICAVIVAISISQITYSDLHSNITERDRICSQIGEIFLSADGDNARFKQALTSAEFKIEIEEDTNEWIVESGNRKFMLSFAPKAHDADDNDDNVDDSVDDSSDEIQKFYLRIGNIGNTATYLTVEFSIENGEKQIIKWSKGD